MAKLAKFLIGTQVVVVAEHVSRKPWLHRGDKVWLVSPAFKCHEADLVRCCAINPETKRMIAFTLAESAVAVGRSTNVLAVKVVKKDAAASKATAK